MESIYDKIKTAKELLTEVQAHGLSTKIEDICRAQDIFGRTSIEELDALANDNGMDGSMSTGRRGTQAVFYQVLFSIWNWEDATRFYNQHSNNEYKELIACRDNANKTRGELASEKEMAELEHRATLDERARNVKLTESLNKLEAELHEREMKIMELKAKLYDLMVKN